MMGEVDSATLPRPPAPSEIDRLESRVQSRLHGRVRHLRLIVCESSLILTGQARTYYAKQLAQHAVMEATTLPIRANEIEVA